MELGPMRFDEDQALRSADPPIGGARRKHANIIFCAGK